MNQLQSFALWKSRILTLLVVSAPLMAHAQSQGSSREGVPTLSGYMEVHLNKEQDRPTEADLHRFVLMVGHSFSDRLKFWSEVEIEHAFVEGAEESGEVAIEQAYVDLMLHRRFNVRAGMVLMPIGIVNERHEPPTFHGVERTFVDTVIVPTTWRDIGVGAFGDLGRGFSYRASADYAFANRTPYTVGVHQSSGIAQRYFPYLPEFDKWYLAPVDTFRVTVGLGYDLSL